MGSLSIYAKPFLFDGSLTKAFSYIAISLSERLPLFSINFPFLSNFGIYWFSSIYLSIAIDQESAF